MKRVCLLLLLGMLLLIPATSALATVKTLGELNIGDKVVDNSWTWEHRTGSAYTGTGVTKPVTWIVVAKNHYGANSGVTLLSEELIGQFRFDNSTHIRSGGSNHWGDSGTHSSATHGLRPWLNSTGKHAGEGFYHAFSQSFKDAVLTTTVPNRRTFDGVSYTTQDRVFVPSQTELGAGHSRTYEIGTVYPYFANASDADRIAKLAGNNRWYWTRSPLASSAGAVQIVTPNGTLGSLFGCLGSDGARPALNLKSEIPVSGSTNAAGYYEILEAAPPPAPPPPVDKTVLDGKILEADAKDQADYTEVSWAPFAATLDAAKTVSADPDATQKQVDTALAMLTTAMTGLVASEPPVDKAELAGKILEAEAKDEADYTEETWAPFATALTAAKAVYDDPEVTQDEVYDAHNRLDAAMVQLVFNYGVIGVTLSPTNLNLTVGQTSQLNATVQPAGAANKNITYSSSNSNVATVSANGTVTAVSTGTATITVFTDDGGFRATCSVTVSTPPIAVTGVSLTQTTLQLTAGDTAQLIHTLRPANATNKTVSWRSSNTSTATVTGGLITALAAGSTTITVTTADGSHRATCTVTVVPVTIAVNSVVLNNTTLNLAPNETAKLIATVLPVDATDQNVNWRSGNNAVSTVNNGLVTAVSTGTTTITVTTADGNRQASCTVTVSPITIPVTGVTLNYSTLSLQIGEKATLNAIVQPGNATSRQVNWRSSNTIVATVSGGTVEALSPGTATITVTTVDGNFRATCTVTVSPVTVPVRGVTLDKSAITLTAGETARLTATVQPIDASDRNITWRSSDTTVATVTDGQIIARSGGSAVITVTATDGNFTASCTITVTEQEVPVRSVSIDKDSITLTVGGRKTLQAVIIPENASNKDATWTSTDTQIAVVNARGVVTALRQGTAIIVVETVDGGHTDACTVTVVPTAVPVTGITLDYTELSLNLGENRRLIATVLPENASAKTVTWSSSNNLITMVSDGLVVAVSPGNAVITVTTADGSHTATCNITVAESEAITIMPPKLTLYIDGASYHLSILPSEKAEGVVWTTNYPDIVAVDNTTGKVSPISVGTAIITATTADGMHTAQCEVTVRRAGIRVEKLTINPSELKLKPGWAGYLFADIQPPNASEQEVTWVSDNTTVAEIVEPLSEALRGSIKAVAPGEAIITAFSRDGGHTATIRVTVYEHTADIVSATNIRLKPVRLNLMAGHTGRLSASIFPINATFKAVEYISDTPGVATVEQDGTVTAYEPGTATIIAISQENPSISAVSEVRVSGKASVEPQAVILDQVRVNLVAGGQQLKLNATVLPSTVINNTVTWSSDTPEVATVDHNGRITPLTRGTARITATSSDGKQHAYCQVNVALSAISVRNVDIYPQVMHLEENGAPAYARTIITPVDATNQEVEWVSSDPTVARVDADGKITPLKPGRAIIQANTRGGDDTAAPVTASAHVYVAKRWSELPDASARKTWTIHFSRPINTATDLSEYIKLTDHNNEPIPAEIEPWRGWMAVEIKPLRPLAPGEYLLHIGGGLTSATGRELSKPVRAKFTVK